MEPVQSLARGLAVIRAFDSENAQLSLSDVARRSDLARATARRALHTLMSMNYVATDGKTFWLRPQVLELGFAYLSSLTLPEVLQPHLLALSEATQESSSAGVLDEEDAVYIARAERRRIMRAMVTVGTRFPASVSSIGRVLLAGLSDEQIEAYYDKFELRRFTDATITDLGRMKEELLQIREQGWALVDQELEIGLCSLAAPVHDASGRVVAAINVSTGPRRGMTPEILDGLLPSLLEHAAAGSRDVALVSRANLGL